MSLCAAVGPSTGTGEIQPFPGRFRLLENGFAYERGDRHYVLSASRDEGEGAAGIQLLEDLRELFRDCERIPTARVVATLTTMEDRPWPEWKRGKPLTSRGLARLLRPFDIRPKNIRLPDGAVVKGYDRAELEDTFSRYLGDGSVTSATASSPIDLRESVSATERAGVADMSRPKPPEQDHVAHDTDWEGGVPAEGEI